MICFNSSCAKEFKPKTHNQKYCSDECCRVSTNKRIMEKYYEKKAIRNGLERRCRCGNKLSRYNQGTVCASCSENNRIETRKRLKRIINDIS